MPRLKSVPFVGRFISAFWDGWTFVDWVRALAASAAAVFAIVFLVAGIDAFDDPEADVSDKWGTLALSAELAVLAFTSYRVFQGRIRETVHATDESINKFLTRFISDGTTMDIVSNRLAWVASNAEMEKFITSQMTEHAEVGLYVAEPSDLTGRLGQAGATVLVHPSGMAEFPRFTLLNRGRLGGRRLAIASGAIPNHRISVFQEEHHPQVIALARTLIDVMRANPT